MFGKKDHNEAARRLSQSVIDEQKALREHALKKAEEKADKERQQDIAFHQRLIGTRLRELNHKILRLQVFTKDDLMVPNLKLAVGEGSVTHIDMDNLGVTFTREDGTKTTYRYTEGMIAYTAVTRKKPVENINSLIPELSDYLKQYVIPGKDYSKRDI